LALESYGFQLRSFRRQRQKSMAWLAAATNLSVSYLSRVETGRRPIPSLSIRAAIAAALDLSSSELRQMESALEKNYSAFEHASRLPGQVVLMVMNFADAEELLKHCSASVTYIQIK